MANIWTLEKQYLRYYRLDMCGKLYGTNVHLIKQGPATHFKDTGKITSRKYGSCFFQCSSYQDLTGPAKVTEAGSIINS